jgi:hypothetical protein
MLTPSRAAVTPLSCDARSGDRVEICAADSAAGANHSGESIRRSSCTLEMIVSSASRVKGPG